MVPIRSVTPSRQSRPEGLAIVSSLRRRGRACHRLSRWFRRRCRCGCFLLALFLGNCRKIGLFLGGLIFRHEQIALFCHAAALNGVGGI